MTTPRDSNTINPAPTSTQIIDLNGDHHETDTVTVIARHHHRTQAALRAMAMENKRHHGQVTSKDRPAPKSSNEALETDEKETQKQWELAQLDEYNKDPIPDVKNDAPSFTADEENDLFKGVKFCSHHPDNKNEMIPGGPFSDGIAQKILGYLGGDINSECTPKYRQEELKLTLFGKTTPETVFMPLAKKVAALILGGEEKEIEEAIALVKKFPEILHCPPVVARDRTDSPDLRLMTPETDVELKEGKKHLYIGRADDGGLDYKILDAESNPIVGHITPKELDQEIKTELTLPNLNQLRGTILDITSKRGHTPLGRAVKGKVLQIAAMAGDVDLPGMEKKIQQAEEKEMKAKTPEEKSKATIEKETLKKLGGVVEQLVAINDGLSPEEVAAQLEEVVTGEKAKLQNQQKVDRIVAAVKHFGEGILSKAKEYKGDIKNYNNFSEFQKLCKPLIDQLRKALQHDPKEVTTSGRIFDESILYKAADWFMCGYELCPMPDKPDNKIKLEKGKLYWKEKRGCYSYSVITPDDKEERHVKFSVNPILLARGLLNESRLKDIIVDAASEAKHIVRNLDRFGGLWTIVSDVFWVNGFGQLQPKLSAGAKDVIHYGIHSVVDYKEIPSRDARSADGVSHISSSSGCGVSHFLGDSGNPQLGAFMNMAFREHFGKFMSSKNNSIAKFMQCPAPSKQDKCVIS